MSSSSLSLRTDQVPAAILRPKQSCALGPTAIRSCWLLRPMQSAQHFTTSLRPRGARYGGAWPGLNIRTRPQRSSASLTGRLHEALAHPGVKARLADLGSTTLPGSPADFGNPIAEDTEKWAEVINTPTSSPIDERQLR